MTSEKPGHGVADLLWLHDAWEKVIQMGKQEDSRLKELHGIPVHMSWGEMENRIRDLEQQRVIDANRSQKTDGDLRSWIDAFNDERHVHDRTRVRVGELEKRIDAIADHPALSIPPLGIELEGADAGDAVRVQVGRWPGPTPRSEEHRQTAMVQVEPAELKRLRAIAVAAHMVVFVATQSPWIFSKRSVFKEIRKLGEAMRPCR